MGCRHWLKLTSESPRRLSLSRWPPSSPRHLLTRSPKRLSNPHRLKSHMPKTSVPTRWATRPNACFRKSRQMRPSLGGIRTTRPRATLTGTTPRRVRPLGRPRAPRKIRQKSMRLLLKMPWWRALRRLRLQRRSMLRRCQRRFVRHPPRQQQKARPISARRMPARQMSARLISAQQISIEQIPATLRSTHHMILSAGEMQTRLCQWTEQSRRKKAAMTS